MRSAKALESERRYRASDRFKETRSRWYAINREKQLARVKLWTEVNKEYVSAKAKQYYAANKARVSLRSTKAGAKRRGLEYSLPDPLALDLMSDTCFYCGDSSELNGIDRVDNSKGYVEDNVVTACKACNRAKHARTRAEFETWALRLAANLQRWQTKVA